MNWLAFFLLAFGSLNGWLGYLIRYRHEHELIAGYDMRRVPDPERLARWLGGWTIVVGLACMAAGAGTAMVPQYTGLILRLVSAVILVGVATAVAGSMSRSR